MSSARWLAIAGLWGAILTAVILAMSFLLRLGTRIEAGHAVSMLAQDTEQWARLAHRVAAMGVGVLAAITIAALARDREALHGRLGPVAGVVALTLLLAIIGRYTPGYRFDLVTVLNVVGGVGLVAAFWWLRLPAPVDGRRRDPLATVALVTLFVVAALGAATDASAMRGGGGYVGLHAALAVLFVVLALAAAWRQRQRRALAAGIAILASAQFTLGVVLEGEVAARPIALAWAHGILALALVPLFVSLHLRRPPPDP